MRRSLVGFESPNFGHAFLDGFEDLDRDEDKEDGYFGEESQTPTRSQRGNRAQDPTFGRGGGRARTLAASDGVQMQGRYPPTGLGLHGLRELGTGTHAHHSYPSPHQNSFNQYNNNNQPINNSQYNNQKERLEESPPSPAGGLMASGPSLDDLLHDPPPDWASCCVCHEIFKKPMTTLCGHNFCYDCIIEVIHRKGSCPLCRQPIGQNEITENTEVTQAISKLLVRCKYGLQLISPPSLPIISSSFSSSMKSISSPFISLSNITSTSTTTSSSSSSHSSSSPTTNPRTGTSPITIRSPSQFSQANTTQARSLPSTLPSFMRTATKWDVLAHGCTEIFELSQQIAHEASCPHRPVSCYHDGCSEQVKSKDLEQHMEVCVRRVIQCPDCKLMLLMSDEMEHQENCSEKEVGCSFKCNQKVRRKEQTEHLNVCTNMEVGCEFAQYGCTHRGLRSGLAEHAEGCLYRGLGAVVAPLKQQLEQQSQQITQQGQLIQELRQELAKTQQELSRSVQTQTSLLSELRAIQNDRRSPSFFRRDSLFN